MSCVLHIEGENFDVESFLNDDSTSTSAISIGKMRPYKIWRKGEKSKVGIKKDKEIEYWHSGCSYKVSDAEFEDFHEQFDDAVEFMKINYDSLKKLKGYEVDDLKFDFGIELDTKGEDGNTWFCRHVEFPLELTKLSSELGIYILLSHYNSDIIG